MSLWGEVLRQYNGTGNIQFGNQSHECAFEAAQFRDSEMRLRCVLDSSEGLQASIENRKTGQIHLSGQLDDNKPFISEGPAINIRSSMRFPGSSELVFAPHSHSTIRVGDLSWNGKAELRFALTNFLFIGTELDEHQKLTILPLTIRGTTVTIAKTADYADRLASIEAKHAIDVTCEARLSVENPDEIDKAKSLIADLCELLTFARGTLISSPYFDVVSSDDTVVYSEHRSAITRPYVTDPVIDPRTIEDTKTFVESVYDRYVELEAIYQLVKVVHIFVDVRHSGFIETRGLALIGIFEHLVEIFVGQNGCDTIIDAPTLKQRRKELKDQTAELVGKLFPTLNDEQLGEVVGRMLDFNNCPLRNKLASLIAHFRVPIADGEIDTFIKTRNRLVHTLAFGTAEPAAEFRKMIELLDKLLLRMFGYEGYYINAETKERQLLRSDGS